MKPRNNIAEGYGAPRFGEGQGELYKRLYIPALGRMDLQSPVHQVVDEHSRVVINLRGRNSQLVTRPGIRLQDEIGGVHSIFQLQDEVVGLTPFLYGTDEYLYHESDLVTPIVDDLSGDPLTAVVARPEKSVNPWMYFADRRKMFTVNAEGSVRNWGISPPKKSPMIVNSLPAETLAVSDFETLVQSGATWNASVGAGALSVVDRVNTTVSAVVQDGAWAIIQPAAMNSGIQVNTRLKIGSNFTRVTQILPQISNTTIAGISYHGVAPGKCTVQLATPTRGLQPNSLILLDTEYVIVDEVINGLDNKPCFTCITTIEHFAGESVTGVVAFRCQATPVVGDTILCKAIQSTINPATGTPKGIGNIRLNLGMDLSQANNVAFTDEDEISLGVYVADINRLIEGRLIFDVDSGTIANSYAASDASRNYYFYAFRPDDLQAIADFNTGTSLIGGTATRVQREYFDQFNLNSDGTVPNAVRTEYGMISSLNPSLGTREKQLEDFRTRYGFDVGTDGKPLFQVGSGKEQWYQLKIKVRDLERIGEDKSRTLRNVTGVMVSMQVSQTNPSTSVTVAVSSCWIGGGSNLDSYASAGSLTSAYYYRYSGYNDTTGDEGLSSPPTRKGILSQRQKNKIKFEGHPDSQVTHLNIYRIGGSLQQWLQVGRVANPGASGEVEFEDNLADGSIANNRLLRFDLYAPVPTAGLPARGTCRVVGNRVTRIDGVPFDPSWAAGNEIVIGERVHLLYAQPEDENTLELNAAAGYFESVDFNLNSPLQLGKPLARTFGPYGGGAEALTYFFCGDADNPGFLYWTNPNDPNSLSDANYIEVSTPNEPLLNGVVYDGRVFVASSERMWQVVPSRGVNGLPSFAAQEVANSRGIASPWAICVDKLIYFLSKDGLYASEGGQPTNLSSATVDRLFPHDGVQGEDVDGVFAIDMADDRYLRLCAYSNSLYLDYLKASRTSQDAVEVATLVYDLNEKGFVADYYADGGVRCRYGGTGGRKADYRLVVATASKVGVMNNPDPVDYNESIFIRWKSIQTDLGSPRNLAIVGDHILSGRVPEDTVDLTIDSRASEASIQTVTEAVSGRFKVCNDYPIDTEVMDLGIDVMGIVDVPVEIYGWEYTLLPRPEKIVTRATDWDDAGHPGNKLVQGFILEADTDNQSITVEVLGDTGVVLETFAIQHNGQSKKTYSLATVKESKLLRIKSANDTAKWQLFNITWVTLPVPEAAKVWQTVEGLDLGYCGWKHVGGAYVDLRSTASSSLSITIDNVTNTYEIPSTAGKVERTYLRFKPIKGKLFSFRLTSTAEVQVFKSTCFHIGDWGRGPETPYRMVNPFGGENPEGALV